MIYDRPDYALAACWIGLRDRQGRQCWMTLADYQKAIAEPFSVPKSEPKKTKKGTK